MIIWFDNNCIQRITTPTNAKAAIASLQAVIDMLISAAAAVALNSSLKEYGFDDGQTKTKMVYQNVGAIAAQINDLIALQQIYLQSPGMNNRVVRLIDASNFVPYNYNI